MQHKTQNPARHFFLFCLLFSLSSVFLNSCKKTDSLVQETKNKVIEETPENFFNLPTNASPVLKRIAKELERQNKSKEFITAFIEKEGFPIWGKSRIERQRKNGHIADFDSDGLEDTTVYVPLVVSAENYVTGFLKATVDDSVDIQIYRQNDYVNFPFNTPTASPNVTTAENFAIRMMTMDHDVFGTTSFEVKDKRLFKNNTDYSDTAEIEKKFITILDSTSGGGGDGGNGFANGSTISNYQYEVCWTVDISFRICPAFGSGGNNTHCPLYTLEITTCTTYETSGGDPGNGGGSGGGGSSGGSWPFPPSGPGGGGAPCSEEFGASLTNSIIPIECNPSGGNPWPPLHPTVQALRLLLGISSVQMDWLINHLSKATQVLTYLEDNNGSTEIANAHIIKMMEDEDYLSFDNNHSATGDNTKMWWDDEDWLDDPDNFNLDITRSPTELQKLTAREKALVAQFPIQAYIIRENIQEAFDQSAIVYGSSAPGLNDKKDAFRHAFFQAINTRDCPPQLFPIPLSASYIVRQFAEAHEDDVPSHLNLEKQMDLFNNEVGIQYCSNCYNNSNTSISNAILAIAQAGNLRYLHPIDYTGHGTQSSTFWDNPSTTTPHDGHHGINQNPSQQTALTPTNQ